MTATTVLLTNIEIAGVRALRPCPLGMTQMGVWDGFAHPSRISGLLGAGFIAAELTLIPAGVSRLRWWITSTALFVVFAFAQL